MLQKLKYHQQVSMVNYCNGEKNSYGLPFLIICTIHLFQNAKVISSLSHITNTSDVK